MKMAQAVSINVKSDAMIDEKLDILVTGLERAAKVTLQSHLTQNKTKFEAHGHYIADSHGRVKLNEEQSVGGTYYGLEPMGLFWSLQPFPKPSRPIYYHHKDITAPEVLHLTVHKGHLDAEELTNNKPIAKATIKRYIMANDVERIPIRHGKIRGILYKPKGPGPFPGILHLYGLTGTIWDLTACRLASDGFAVFHLLYHGFYDLPKKMDDIELEYFYEALDWFCSEPYVREGGIQGVGLCAGGQLALLLASLLPDKVAAVVSINGMTILHEPGFKFKGNVLPHVKADHSKAAFNSDGALIAKYSVDVKAAPEETQIKVENARKILFIVGGDDQCAPGLASVQQSVRRLQAHGRNNFELLHYPGAGHLIDIPYLPLVTTTLYRGSNIEGITNVYMDWGGKANAHARAQEDSWQKIREFLLKNLTESSDLKCKL